MFPRTYVVLITITFFAISPIFSKVVINIPDQDVRVTNNSGLAEFQADELYGEPGQPLLPVYTVSVLLPPDADLNTVTCSLADAAETEIAGKFDVAPTPPPMTINGLVSWPQNRNILNGKDVAVYTSNKKFPATPVTVTDIGQLSCFKMVEVKISLVRYNPAIKTLFLIQKGSLFVNYMINPSYRAPKDAARIPEEVKFRAQNTVANFKEFINAYSDAYTFVRENCLAIITTSAIKSKLPSFDALVAARQEKGYKVEVVTEEAWGGGTGATGAANIRKWLQANYQAKGINYCLLIGDPNDVSGDVPMSFFTGYAPGWGAPHEDTQDDWHYEQLTGDYKADKQGEVHVGRFPIWSGDYAGTDKIIQKTVEYSKSKDPSWRYNALFGGPGYDASSTSWKALNPAYDSYIVPTAPWKAYRCYSSMYATPVSADEVSNDISGAWSKGKYGIVVWCAHGASTLAQGAMTSSATTKVTNNYPSFVQCGSCSNADIASASNLTYSILKNCGVGAIGGTDYTMVGDDMTWGKMYVKYMVADKMTIGETMTTLKAKNSNGWYNIAPYVIYGDPTLGVYVDGTVSYISSTVPLQSGTPRIYAQVASNSIQFRLNGIKHTGASLRIYSLKGITVTDLQLKPGFNTIAWDKTSGSGTAISAGTYIVFLMEKTNATEVATIKLTISK